MRDSKKITLICGALCLAPTVFLVTSCEPKVASLPVSVAVDEGLDPIVSAKYKTSPSSDPSEWGAMNCHDPSVFRDDDGTYYAFSTDANIGPLAVRGIQVRTSRDLVNWACLPESAIRGNWDQEMLSWTEQTANDASTWAPRVVKLNGRYLMYHGVMTDADSGKPRGWIGLAVSDSPAGPYVPASAYDSAAYPTSTVVRYAWNADEASDGFDDSATLNSGSYDTSTGIRGSAPNWGGGFGAIDPDVTRDADGNLWLVYGSWKGGIAILRLDNESGLPLDPSTAGTASERPLSVPADEVVGAFGTKIAGGGGAAYEGPQVFYRAPYYYLVMSSGKLSYDYSVRLGRSESVTGPYVDANGYDLRDAVYDEGGEDDFHAHGNKLLGGFKFAGEYGWRSPGGPSVFEDGSGNYYLAAHSRTDFREGWYFYLQVRSLYFTDDGWPVVNPNEYYGDSLRAFAESEIPGLYDAVMSVRGGSYGAYTGHNGVTANESSNLADSVPAASVTVVLGAGGTIGGAYGGAWSLAEDGCTLTLELETPGGEGVGTFKGVMLDAVDWARRDSGSGVARKTVSFTASCSDDSDPKCGEYFFGNKRNY